MFCVSFIPQMGHKHSRPSSGSSSKSNHSARPNPNTATFTHHDSNSSKYNDFTPQIHVPETRFALGPDDPSHISKLSRVGVQLLCQFLDLKSIFHFAHSSHSIRDDVSSGDGNIAWKYVCSDFPEFTVDQVMHGSYKRENSSCLISLAGATLTCNLTNSRQVADLQRAAEMLAAESLLKKICIRCNPLDMVGGMAEFYQFLRSAEMKENLSRVSFEGEFSLNVCNSLVGLPHLHSLELIPSWTVPLAAHSTLDFMRNLTSLDVHFNNISPSGMPIHSLIRIQQIKTLTLRACKKEHITTWKAMEAPPVEGDVMDERDQSSVEELRLFSIQVPKNWRRLMKPFVRLKSLHIEQVSEVDDLLTDLIHARSGSLPSGSSSSSSVPPPLSSH